MKSPKLRLRSTWRSVAQRSRPDSASSAITFPSGVLTYITPSSTSGVASNDVELPVSTPASPVLYSQATTSFATLARVIPVSGEYRSPPRSRPYAGQSPGTPDWAPAEPAPATMPSPSANPRINVTPAPSFASPSFPRGINIWREHRGGFRRHLPSCIGWC